MTVHSPLPWSQGRTLLTRETRRWTRDAILANNAIEDRFVFSQFSERDEGRSRILIARCELPLDARFISAAPDMYMALLAVDKCFNTNPGNEFERLANIANKLVVDAVWKAEGRA